MRGSIVRCCTTISAPRNSSTRPCSSTGAGSSWPASPSRCGAEEGVEDCLRAFVYGYIDYIYEHQDMARLMLNECLCGGGVLERHLAAAIEAREEVPGLLLEDRLRAAIGAGEIREIDLRHTLLTIVSACLFPFVALPTVRLFHSRAVEDFDRFLQERKAHIVDLLLAGLRPMGGIPRGGLA